MLMPAFDRPVPPGGYGWWYVDALSDDGTAGVTVIGFVGSVFSPYYAWSGRAHPEDHVAINAALYLPTGARWAMTERGSGSLEREAALLRVGGSSMSVSGEELHIALDEVGFPVPRRVKGTLRLKPSVRTSESISLDAAGLHRWWPIAPRARVSVEFEHPALTWSGDAYFDSNWGEVPLERSFRAWTWSRAALEDRAIVQYEVENVDGSRFEMGLDIGPSGTTTRFDLPARVELADSGWGIKRHTRSEVPDDARLIRTLEDTPFYARSLVRSQICGSKVTSVHESLSLERLSALWVKCLLPFRMPRRASGNRA